ncbi:MAG: biotin/lipoyl-containing protein [Agrobacterium sp.]|nr:biotin/lipoyl-containing protein [Agrobacterium sp.]
MLSEIEEVEQEDLRIRVPRAAPPIRSLCRSAPLGYTQHRHQRPQQQLPPRQRLLPPQRTVRSPANTVTSPLVGTVYLSPAPGARPFVKWAQAVKEGQTDITLVVEAMKAMNQITAARSGKVLVVWSINDSRPVE